MLVFDAEVEVEKFRGTDVDAVRPVSVEERGVLRTLMAERRVLSLLKDILRGDLVCCLEEGWI